MKKIFLESIDSTNDYAKRIAKKINENVFIIANNQTSGRGTKGRCWISEEGVNILVSFLIKDVKDSYILNDITIKIGKIIHEALSKNYDLTFEIKPPNDILCNGKKLCGILCESSISENKVNYLIIGIGLNVNQVIFNKELINIATSLKKELGFDIDREELTYIIHNKIEELFN